MKYTHLTHPVFGSQRLIKRYLIKVWNPKILIRNFYDYGIKTRLPRRWSSASNGQRTDRRRRPALHRSLRKTHRQKFKAFEYPIEDRIKKNLKKYF